jgi:hypothetical protein
VFGWGGAMFFPGSAPMEPVSLSGKNSITFWTKGVGKTYQVMLWAKSKGALPLMKSFTAGPEWTRVSLPLCDFGTDGHDLDVMKEFWPDIGSLLATTHTTRRAEPGPAPHLS